MRAEVIETLKDTAIKYVLDVPSDLSDFLRETVNSKKWHSTFGFSGRLNDESLNPTLVLLRNIRSLPQKKKTKQKGRQWPN